MNKNMEVARKRYETAKAISANTGKGAPQTSKIRICVPFVAGESSYDIDIRDAKGHITNSALQLNDKFVAVSGSVGFMVETEGKAGHAPTLPYPLMKSADVTAAGLKGLDNSDAYVMYNGHLSLKTNQEVNWQKFPLSLFLAVPAMQEKKVFGANVSDSAFLFPEEMTLSGKEDHAFRVEFPGKQSTDIKGEAGSTAYLVFELYGYTIQGAAK